MSPKKGAELWKQIEDAATGAGVKLVAPSVNQFEPGENDPYGHQWTWAMVDEYEKLYGKKPRFDAIAWNIFGCTDIPACKDINEMQQYLKNRRNEALAKGYDIPFWIVEYGSGCQLPNSGFDSDRAIMQEMAKWFEQTSWVTRYAWYASRISNVEAATGVDYRGCSLVNPATNAPTALGELYRGF